MQKRPVILRSLLVVATPYFSVCMSDRDVICVYISDNTYSCVYIAPCVCISESRNTYSCVYIVCTLASHETHANSSHETCILVYA